MQPGHRPRGVGHAGVGVREAAPARGHGCPDGAQRGALARAHVLVGVPPGGPRLDAVDARVGGEPVAVRAGCQAGLGELVAQAPAGRQGGPGQVVDHGEGQPAVEGARAVDAVHVAAVLVEPVEGAHDLGLLKRHRAQHAAVPLHHVADGDGVVGGREACHVARLLVEHTRRAGGGIGDDGRRPDVGLDARVVLAPHHPEVAVLAPCGAPAVLDNPVLDAPLHPVADQFDRVATEGAARHVAIDALGVVEEVDVHREPGGDRTVGDDLLHDGGLAGQVAVRVGRPARRLSSGPRRRRRCGTYGPLWRPGRAGTAR
eukprot:GAFH01001142.1.p2 GENE.GAFH01001142.1~~GAFH01001142.1.p2  ORF type:complete len:315 (+),score=50.23 GAFH01001142.1:584-1528(+)